jgi:hypothetical protein
LTGAEAEGERGVDMTNLVGQILKGRSKSVLVEDDAVTISYRALYHGFKGDKRIPYTSITAVQLREPGWLVGYLQFSIQGGIEARDPLQDENAIEFDKPADEFRALRDLIQAKMAAEKAPSRISLADELEKLAGLLERGVLTPEEFAAQKARLLG